MTTCRVCRFYDATDGGRVCRACRAARVVLPAARVSVLPSRTEADPALFIALCQQHGLPEPVAEYRFAAPRRWRFDFAWPDRRVALEVEGGAFSQGRHVRGKGYKADCEKYSEAAALGWRLLRVLPSQLCTAETISLIRRTMALTQNGAAIGELPLPATTVENSGTLGVT